MSSRGKVSNLKEKIIKCQDETLQLLQEKQMWSEKSKIMEQTEADLRRQKLCNSIQPSKFEKELEDLKKALRNEEENESVIKEIFDRRQVTFAEYKKCKDLQLIKIERNLVELEEIVSDESGVNELCKRRIEMEKRLKNLDVFCAAMYSTLESKESSGVSLLKEAKLDHPGGQNGQKTRKRRGSKKSQ
ncbi:hypothetical protein ABKV19_026985 [Rosa sericea]